MKARIVIITGATGGIGSALVRKLAENGSETFFFLQGNRRLTELEPVRHRLLETCAGCELFRADFGVEGEADRFADSVFDRIDTFKPETIGAISWVNAAGVDLMTQESKALSFEGRLRLMFQQEVEPAIRTARRAGKRIQQIADKREGTDPDQPLGTILFFGWDGVGRGMEGETAQLYGAAKGAIVGYAKSLAQELAPQVRVLSISPGWIATTWGAKASAPSAERGRSESLSDRWGKPEEVADLAAFLLSERAVYINAQNIEINGGYNFRKRQV